VSRGLALALCLLTGCAAPPASAPNGRTVWRGEVHIDEDLVLPRGSELVIEPGTTVHFSRQDRDDDGWGDTSLRVEGNLIAVGTPEAPIVFTSATAPAEPGSWGEVRIDFGSFRLRYVVVEGSTRGLHAHFSRGRVEDCVFRRNVDGTRFGESTVEVEQCLFYGHPGKALNARKCRNRVRHNLFRDNRNGIFLFEEDAGSAFEENAFVSNEHPLRLGDFFVGTVQTRGNDWGKEGPPPERGESDEARLLVHPGRADSAGPRAWPRWKEVWRAPLEGFVDAEPVLADEGVYAASWSGVVARLGFLDGKPLSAQRLPDAVDARLAFGPGGLAATQAWNRRVYLLHRGDLAILDTVAEEPSPADDHRQAGPVFSEGVLIVGTWAGKLRAFTVAGEQLAPLWEFQADGPFRADLKLAGGKTLLAPCEDGRLYALNADTGTLLWVYRAGAPLLSAPAVAGDAAFLADRSGRLHAVSLTQGRILWTRELAGSAWYAPPLYLDGVLFQGEDSGRLWALAASDGRVLWSANLGAGIRSRPAAANPDLLVVPTAGGRVYLVDRTSGFERDSLLLSAPALSSPASLGDRVFLGARDGMLHALQVEWFESGN